MSDLTFLLKQVQEQLKAGQHTAALTLLKQAHQQAPRDYRVWLLLAQAAPDRHKQADCIRRAQQLAPQATAVQKAVAWLDKKQATPAPPLSQPVLPSTPKPISPPPAPLPPPSKPAFRRRQLWLAATTAVVLLLAIIVGVGWFWGGATVPLTAQLTNAAVPGMAESVAPSATPLPLLAAAEAETENASIIERATATATASPPPTATPLFALPNSFTQPLVTATAVNLVMADVDTAVNAKPISLRAEGDDPRPTWTATPVPTNTPTPTPSPQPTFIAEGGPIKPASVRPGEKWIDINLTTQTLRAYEGDKLVLESIISSGRPPYYTVTGQFRIYLRYDTQTMDGRSLGFDYVTPNVPHVQYFYGNFALHGAFWHNDFGTPVSHGCVNVNLTDAAWLYEWADYGTLVNVHY